MNRNRICKVIFSIMILSAMLFVGTMAACADWEEMNGGRYQYMDEEGNYLTGWQNEVPGFEGKWFYFDEEGYMTTGWFQDSGKWYHFSEENDADMGVMTTGWFQEPEDGAWYYFYDEADDDERLGQMVTGWFQDPSSGEWYYFNEESDGRNFGKMLTGKQTIDGKMYVFDENGKLVEGDGVASVFSTGRIAIAVAVPLIIIAVIAAAVLKKRKGKAA